MFAEEVSYLSSAQVVELRRSPPARGRGLKRDPIRMPAGQSVSPPARGRGLKRADHSTAERADDVAPRAGAWIETDIPSTSLLVVGSPPARGRGLKPFRRASADADAVAPRAGAWIETMIGSAFGLNPRSPPARGRGLKHDILNALAEHPRRPPRGGVD